MKKKAIIDFDTVVFRACLKGQGNYFEHDEDFNEDIDYNLIKQDIDDTLNSILFETGCTLFELHLTGQGNFRYSILPSYKWRREGLPRPEALLWAKNYTISVYPTIMKDGVEADDTAIQAFEEPEEGIVKILCHIDKDLDQVAGRHYNYDKLESYNISKEQAENLLWKQVLIGDTADCYLGCPMIGETKAQKIIEENLNVKPFLHHYIRGAKRGMTEVRWEEFEDPTATILERVKNFYIKGYYTKGGVSDDKGYNTPSGYKHDVKIDIDWELNKPFLSKVDDAFINKEIEKQYTIARMLRYGEEVPTQPIKLFK